jgi:Co/Zn/Cd efflux system component
MKYTLNKMTVNTEHLHSNHCDSQGQHNHDYNFDGTSKPYKRALWLVILINAFMFIVEISAGITAQSQALKADALDFLMDSLTYTISLLVIGKSIQIRSKTALIKGYSLFAIVIIILASTTYRVLINNEPDAPTMGSIATLGLVANLISVLILIKFRNGDANVSSVWLCSRNDAIGNILVLMSASVIYLKILRLLISLYLITVSRE